ncbi:thioredoxin family protein [Flavobacterium rhizosphaerae]|uniref:Thioredoxin family protein n=1 Tax=Flavobacterium rhizosphaerae TaxID=3163298 RepID=A0ABW8YZT8_9FLAO
MTDIASIIEKSLKNGYTYNSYRAHIKELLEQGLSTGPAQSELLTHYSTLNDVRMSRLDKTLGMPDTIVQKLQNLEQEYIALVITEGWCGDAAQIVPVIHLMSEATHKLDLKLVLRDENPELMDEYLTNGARSIPIVVFVNKETLQPVAQWGPRPAGGTNLINEAKEKFGKVTDEAKTDLQKWYLKDKGLSTMHEIAALLQ